MNSLKITDELMYRAVDYSVKNKSSSVSILDEKLECGAAAAALIIDEMEQLGIVGDYRNGRPRRVLMTQRQWKELLSEK